MAKLFSTLLFSFFLLFQTASIANEDNISTEIAAEETNEAEESKNSDRDNDDEQQQEEAEAKEELSELEKEALAAEEAELREAGMEE